MALKHACDRTYKRSDHNHHISQTRSPYTPLKSDRLSYPNRIALHHPTVDRAANRWTIAALAQADNRFLSLDHLFPTNTARSPQ